MNSKTRMGLTAGIVTAGWGTSIIVNSHAMQTIAQANLASAQFADSDLAAGAFAAGGHVLSHAARWIWFAAAALIAMVWSAPALLRTTKRTGAAVAIGAAIATGSTPAHAFFETTDKTEAVTIMPNESAFWIPDTGANKDSQAGFDSEAYYAANKVALKRFIIPHVKLSGTGGTAMFSGWDSYVPTGRLIIVDRAPYTREWTATKERGTSARDESQPCQTKEGLNVTTEVSVAASVSEENSPRFLHFFGVNNPPGDRGDPHVIFASVYYGRTLTQVMDTIGRGLIHTAICQEIGSRTLDQANADSAAIMQSVNASATKFLGSRGITVDYLGWGGTWTFDADVQRAINDRYTGEHVAPVLGSLQAKAMIDAIEGWDRRLPTSVNLSWWPSSLADSLGALIKPGRSTDPEHASR